MTSSWVRWRLKSPASRLFSQPFIQGADQRKHQRAASLAFVMGIHRWPVNSLTKGQYRGKCFDLMTSSCNTSKVQKSHFGMLFTRQARSSIYGSEYIATRSRYCWTFITYSCYRDSFSGPSDCCSWHFLFVWHMVNHPSRACFLQYLDRLSLHYTDSKLFIVTTDHITSIRTKFHSDVIMVKSVYRATNALR